MKLKLALLSALALMAQPVLADHYVESNLAFSFKFFANNSKVETETTESRTYSTFTLKNFDLIDAYNAVKTTEGKFTSKARIIKQDLFNEDGVLLSKRILFREGTTEEDVTAYFTFETYDRTVSKFKYKSVEGTGTENAIVTTSFNYVATDPESSSPEAITARGMDKISRKTVEKDGELMDLDTISSSLTGEASFYVLKKKERFSGLVQGTYKASGAKILPAPSMD